MWIPLICLIIYGFVLQSYFSLFYFFIAAILLNLIFENYFASKRVSLLQDIYSFNSYAEDKAIL